ncbi:MAG: hypothetical protein WA888_17145 [Burkholderiaceae bacterium]
MDKNLAQFPTKQARCIAVIVLALGISGCTVITVAGAAVGVAATVAGTAADVAVGTVKVGAKVGAKAVDVVIGD